MKASMDLVCDKNSMDCSNDYEVIKGGKHHQPSLHQVPSFCQ